jgi:hypothetical protein
MKKIPLIVVIVLFLPTAIYSQGSVTPNQAYPGDTVNLYIAGDGTNFQEGVSIVSVNNDQITIVAGSTEVTSWASLTTRIIIPPDVAAGPYQITVTTNSEVVSYDFELLEPSGEHVILTIIPADPLYLSSFDPDDPQNSPLVFLIEIINNETANTNVFATFTLRNEDYGGIIGTAEKNYGKIKENESVQFDNREFDNYNIESTAGALLDEAMQTGMLPPGEYLYQISVTSNEGDMGDDEGYNIVTNIIFSIDLIGPGNPTDENPEIVYSPNPYFQWFSMANAYDFTLYEVMEGQTAPDEISTNLPVYQEANLGTTQFLYPNYAELLETGKTYAWQVKAYFEGSMGQETFYSDVFWFSYMQGEGIYLDHIEVIPDEVTLNTGEIYQFHAVGFHANGDTVQINCDWQVVPSFGGTIDTAGFFVAGNSLSTFAIVAKYNQLSNYGTVTVSYANDSYFDMYELFIKTYGLDKKH